MDNLSEQAKSPATVTIGVGATTQTAKVVPIRRAPLVKASGEDILAIPDETEKQLQMSSQIDEVDGLYVRISKKGTREPISNFTLKIAEQLKGERQVIYAVDIHMQNGTMVRQNFSNQELSKLAKFKDRLSEIGLPICFHGNQSNLDDIFMRIASEPYPTKKSVDHIGIFHSGDRAAFASQNRCIFEDGTECAEFVVNEAAADIETDLLEYSPITAEELDGIIGPLFGFNSLPITATVIGYVVSCFLRPLLKSVGIKHGSLLLIGESGGGKSTTLDELIRPIFGCGTPVSAADLTEASLRIGIGSSNAIPFIIEEFKSAKLSRGNINTICNALRNNYDQTLTRKCGGSNTIIEKQLRAPVILVGESQPSETAIRERCLQVLFSKAALEDHPEYSECLTLLRRQPELLHKLGRSLLQTALRVDVASLKQTHESWMAAAAEPLGSLPIRVRNSVANGVLGLELLDSLCSELDQPLENILGVSMVDLFRAIHQGVVEYLLDGRSRNRSIVEETLATMFGEMQLEEGVDYQLINDNSQVALDLVGVYGKFLQYVRSNEQASEIEILPKNQFLAQLKQTKYFISLGTTRFRRTKPKQSVKLDLLRLQEYLGESLSIVGVDPNKAVPE